MVDWLIDLVWVQICCSVQNPSIDWLIDWLIGWFVSVAQDFFKKFRLWILADSPSFPHTFRQKQQPFSTGSAHPTYLKAFSRYDAPVRKAFFNRRREVGPEPLRHRDIWPNWYIFSKPHMTIQEIPHCIFLFIHKNLLQTGITTRNCSLSVRDWARTRHHRLSAWPSCMHLTPSKKSNAERSCKSMSHTKLSPIIKEILRMQVGLPAAREYVGWWYRLVESHSDRLIDWLTD